MLFHPASSRNAHLSVVRFYFCQKALCFRNLICPIDQFSETDRSHGLLSPDIPHILLGKTITDVIQGELSRGRASQAVFLFRNQYLALAEIYECEMVVFASTIFEAVELQERTP
jgi:hypothetical protein